MLRSMFTAISSLNLHQNYLDVIADNLANANTVGFKSSRVMFQDQVAQVMSPGVAPLGNQGGVNPTEVGLGVQIGYISPVFTQGMLQSTGRNLDMAIQGDGFFIYGQGNDRRYSREGAIDIDAAGYLVNNSTGMRVQGWTLPTGSAATSIDTTQPIGDIQLRMDASAARSTTLADFGGNLSADTVINTATPPAVTAGSQFTSTLGVYDSLGELHNTTITFTRSGTSTWDWSLAGTTPAASGVITFDANGQVTTATGTTGVTMTTTNGSGNIVFDVDLTKMTMLSADSDVSLTNQDGLPAGSVTGLYVTPNTGEVYLIFSNGMKQLAAQVATARFTNPSGLIRSGHNLFRSGLNSGEAVVGASNTGGRGAITTGYLEASNVDMAQEFTNMILAQRGFQANSRVITTSDEMLQELVNLKR